VDICANQKKPLHYVQFVITQRRTFNIRWSQFRIRNGKLISKLRIKERTWVFRQELIGKENTNGTKPKINKICDQMHKCVKICGECVISIGWLIRWIRIKKYLRYCLYV
jgi:hypothetical protein